MKPALILIALLGITGLILYLLDRRSERRAHGGVSDDDATAPTPATSEACGSCSLDEVCIGTAAIACQVEPITYYDDEELDAYAGHDDADYTDTEVEQWRDVLYTLQPSDLVGWGQSIKKRGIVMPRAIHDEFMMLVSERSTQ